jgi:hypothetical protein
MTRQAIVGILLSVWLAQDCPSPRAGETSIYAYPGSCGDWSALVAGSVPALQYRAWVLGYMSGVASTGTFATNFLDASTPGGAIAWVDAYCKSHPLERISDAAHEVTSEVAKRAKQLKAPP